MKFPKQIFVTLEDGEESSQYLLASKDMEDAFDGTQDSTSTIRVGIYTLVRVEAVTRELKSTVVKQES